MRLDRGEERGKELTLVTLSRRNLRVLLAKLDGYPAESACSILKIEPDGILIVRAEEDAEHYGSRGHGPGEMVPETENAL